MDKRTFKTLLPPDSNGSVQWVEKYIPKICSVLSNHRTFYPGTDITGLDARIAGHTLEVTATYKSPPTPKSELGLILLVQREISFGLENWNRSKKN